MIQKATTMGAQLISEFYEIYFNVQYPVPKMEIVALPDAVGNNESPGLITFRQRHYPIKMYRKLNELTACKTSLINKKQKNELRLFYTEIYDY